MAAASRPFSQKVFGIGYGKTGTTTLGECFKLLGSRRHTTYSHPLVKAFVAGRLNKLFKVSDVTDTFEDMPWALAYPSLAMRYPKAQFVLTTRDPVRRFVSLVKHVERQTILDPSVIQVRSWMYGVDLPMKDHVQHLIANREAVIARTVAHDRAVVKFFEGADRLLVVDWEKGDQWEVLCEFLHVAVPKVSFPHANRAPLWQSRKEESR